MRREILDLQRKLALTTIFVTHDQEEANTISDRIAVLNDGIIQQVGSPMELYDQPANRFVAHFLGTANLIKGAVRQTDGKTLFEAPDSIRLFLDGIDIATGAEQTAMIRPQNLRISAESRTVDETHIELLGRVEHREFLGNIIRYYVRLGENLLVVDDTHQVDRLTFDIGEAVVLDLDTRHVQILTKDNHSEFKE